MKEIEKKILKSTSDLQKILNQWNAENQSVVFTNGCFDILHLGHIKLLSESRKLGDKLIVGLNTDKSIKKLKGENRPVNNNHSRSLMLGALSFVDLIIFFSEPTPIKLIEKICPNVLTKGEDYEPDTVIGATKVLSYGGLVKLIPLVPNLSTTSLIKKNKL